MASQSRRLSARFVVSVTEQGTYADGDGLYLIVSPTGAKRWTFIFFWQSKRKELGLGKLAGLPLADARESADGARRMVAKGINPIEAKKAGRAAEANKVIYTFGKEAEAYINAHATSFRNAKHIDQWRMTMSVQRGKDGKLLDSGYCLSIRDKDVTTIDTADVLSVLQPNWLLKPETASRVRGRIERVLDASRAAGRRAGENPARWRGHLNTLLPKRQKLTRGHHAAMPYADVPGFLVRLQESVSLGAKALELLILCTSRTSEVIGAKWPEFDLEAKVWTVPAERMKAGRRHRVPLTDRAVEILQALLDVRSGD